MTTDASAISDDLTGLLSAASGIPATLVRESQDKHLAELGLDSLAAMYLQAAVKDKFGVVIPDDALEMSFAEIAAHVLARLGSEG